MRMTTTQREEESAARRIRRARGLSLDETAVRAGISRATLYYAERAPQLMSERTAAALARVLDVPVEELRP